MNPRIVAIVGTSDSGKTTLLEKLVRELTRRGYRVGTVKHDIHGFSIDHEGKDSYRHKAAGAMATAIISPTLFALVCDLDRELLLPQAVARYLPQVDIVLAEGFKRTAPCKVEVHRAAQGRGLLCAQDPGLLAVATDEPLEVAAPQFALDDAAGLAGFLEAQLLSPQPEAIDRPLTLLVNGVPVGLKAFIANFLIRSVTGAVSSLRGCESPDTIDIHIG